MTTLQQQLADREAAAADKAAAAREAAHAKYIEIVARADSPKAGDAEALSDLFPVLEKSATDFETDVQNWQKLQRAEQRAATIPERRQEADQAERVYRKAAEALPAKVRALNDEVAELSKQADTAESRRARAERSVQEAETFRQRLGLT